ncbi:MAG: cytidine deaminase [Lachnospiraceae bacterium]|nr:cytidine deaminase [Lachnospiraceae bacterium]
MEKETMQSLMRVAIEYRLRAYAPYSKFKVGAALLTEEGQIFGGCNIENASYTPTNCAERTAFFKAVSEGYFKFKGIAIVGGKEDAELQFCAPCGVCRQVMMEFCDPETFIVVLGTSVDDFKAYTLKEILPLGFGPEDLK